MKKFSLFFLLSILLFSFSLSSTTKSKYKSKKEIESQIKIHQKKLKEEKIKKRSVMYELNKLDKLYNKISNELENTKLRLKKVKKDSEYLNKELDKAILKHRSRLRQLKNRLVTFYKHGNLGYSEVLLNSKDLNDFLDRSAYLRYIVSYDIKMLNEIKERQEEIKSKRDIIEQKYEEINELEKKYLQQENELLQQKKMKTELIKQIDEKIEYYEQIIRQLEKSSREIEELIQKKSKSIRKYSNTLQMWPLEGRINSGFGYRIHPIFRKYLHHNGIDIEGNYGDNVKAVAAGEVIFSGWYGGYGNTVIIQHSPTLSTLYAHGSRLLVSEGDTVSIGQTIMKVGSTGYSTGSHLHFEVRINGKPVNPLNYLP